MLVEALGDSPKGSNVCFHRQARNICARMPKGKERSIQVQFISSVITWKNRPKSSPLYIQYRIAPPKRTGKMIFAALMKTVFISMGAKIVQIERNTKFIWIFPRCRLSSSAAQRYDHILDIRQQNFCFLPFFVQKCCLCAQTAVSLHCQITDRITN